MKVLILTNRDHADFVVGFVVRLDEPEHEFMFKYRGEYDWSEDYDIGISFMYTYKVPAEQVNTHTWLNFHPGPLPAYKGRNLCYHAIMNGEKEFGATVHYMDENFDTGEIIHVKTFPISQSDTAKDVYEKAIEASKSLFKAYLPRILRNTVFPCMPNVGGTYYKKEPINEFVGYADGFAEQVRAIYFPPHYPKVNIGGVTYKIVRDE